MKSWALCSTLLILVMCGLVHLEFLDWGDAGAVLMLIVPWCIYLPIRRWCDEVKKHDLEQHRRVKEQMQDRQDRQDKKREREKEWKKRRARERLAGIDYPSSIEQALQRLEQTLHPTKRDTPKRDTPMCIYILKNSKLPDICKVGMTTHTAQKRCKEINRSTGQYGTWSVYTSYNVQGDLRRHEKTAHRILRRWQSADNGSAQELFDVNPAEAHEHLKERFDTEAAPPELTSGGIALPPRKRKVKWDGNGIEIP